MDEIYKHTEAKTDINRNMIALIFARNPATFKQEDEDVQRILKNNVSWPKNYYPKNFTIKRPAPPKSKEELDRIELKKKHKVIL